MSNPQIVFRAQKTANFACFVTMVYFNQSLVAHHTMKILSFIYCMIFI